MTRFRCRHCGDDTGTSDSHVCGRCSCLPVAERGRPREAGDDDVRQPSRCNHCGRVGQGAVCDSCQDLLSDLGEPDEPTNGWTAPAPARDAETEAARRERFHQARVAAVNASFVRGRRCLLARALGGFPGGLERAQPKL